MTAEYRALGIDPSDADLFAEAAAAGVPGNLVIVRSADSGLAFEAACLAAAAKLVGEHAMLDLHRATPAGDRWTIDEIDERILRPARLKAFERTHIVVAEADQMTPAGYDHVLKTVEEPTSGAQFWFTVTDVDRLPVTLRGRSAAQFTVRPAPAEQRISLLEAAGAAPELARTIAELAGDDVRLALAVAGHPDLLEDLRTYRITSPSSTAPTADADRLLAAILRLAGALPSTAPDSTGEAAAPVRKRTRASASKATGKATAPRTAALRPKWDSLPATARPDARRLVRRLLDRWAADLIAQIPAADTAARLASVDESLRALDRARREMATNAPAATALPALLARVNR